MSNGLNLKEISKQIKSSGKSGSVIWAREEKQNFISNRHFLLRVDLVPSDILVALFTVFLKVPAVGETLICSFGKVQDQGNKKPITFTTIYNPEKQTDKGKVTSFIKESGEKLQMRIIQFSEHFTYVNEQLMKMTTDKEPMSIGGPMMPVYFAEGNLLLLPYKVSTPEDNVLSGLINNTVE
ncbi:MAG: hypothetical protein K6T94_21885 [Paenibacillus sp.]|nr:hypothetical protein [Paenibacillus sp.]